MKSDASESQATEILSWLAETEAQQTQKASLPYPSAWSKQHTQRREQTQPEQHSHRDRALSHCIRGAQSAVCWRFERCPGVDACTRWRDGVLCVTGALGASFDDVCFSSVVRLDENQNLSLSKSQSVTKSTSFSADTTLRSVLTSRIHRSTASSLTAAAAPRRCPSL